MPGRFTILVLEDSEERIEGFHRAIQGLGDGFCLKLWQDAPTMLAEYTEHLPTAGLISLDHDLMPRSSTVPNPGTGLVVVQHLSKLPSRCPVILHSSSEFCRRQMHQELQYAGWKSEMIPPHGDDWIESRWLPRVKSILRHGGCSH